MMSIKFNFYWDWNQFLFGVTYEKAYNSIGIAIGFLSILIDMERV